MTICQYFIRNFFELPAKYRQFYPGGVSLSDKLRYGYSEKREEGCHGYR